MNLLLKTFVFIAILLSFIATIQNEKLDAVYCILAAILFQLRIRRKNF